MTRIVWGVAGLIGVSAVAIAVMVGPREAPAVPPPSTAPVGVTGVAASVQAGPTLYCEFTNFADQNPRVGFYFEAEPARQSPVYGLVFQREQDGTQAEFGQDGTARPQWAMTFAESPAVLRSPDESIAINLYEFDPKRAGTTWFEAGLRSIRYLNLGGRCRLSSA